MLNILPTRGDHKIAEPSLVTTDALWLDLLNPTSTEVTSVEEAIGAKLPTLGALSEIESSSRLRSRGGILSMSTPSAAGRPEGAQTTPPIGFVLSTDRLKTREAEQHLAQVEGSGTGVDGLPPGGESQPPMPTLFESIVIAAVKAMALPQAMFAPVVRVMLAWATIDPEKSAELPTEGKYKGRKPTARTKADAIHWLAAEDMTREAISAQLGVSVRSVYRSWGWQVERPRRRVLEATL